MIWTQGLLHLALLFFFNDSAQQSHPENLRIKLRAMHIHQAMYTWPRLLRPNAWGNSLGPQLWSDLHNFLQRTPSDVHLDEINDDLVGFFNSVPRQQILLS